MFDYLFIHINDLVFFADEARGGVSYVYCGRNSSKEDEERLIYAWSGPLQPPSNARQLKTQLLGFRKMHPG